MYCTTDLRWPGSEDHTADRPAERAEGAVGSPPHRAVEAAGPRLPPPAGRLDPPRPRQVTPSGRGHPGQVSRYQRCLSAQVGVWCR